MEKYIKITELLKVIQKKKYLITGKAQREGKTWENQNFPAISEKDLMIELGFWKEGYCNVCSPNKLSITTFKEGKCCSCGNTHYEKATYKLNSLNN